MGRRGPKSWASTEQIEFLSSRLSQYVVCQKTKAYKPFFTNTWNMFETQWPERKCTDNSVPIEGDLTENETRALVTFMEKRKVVSIQHIKSAT